MIEGVPPELGGKAVVLFSAGKDSATSLRIAEEAHDEVVPLFIHFGTDESATNLEYVYDFFGTTGAFELVIGRDQFFPPLGGGVNEREGVLDEVVNREGGLERDVPYIPMRTVNILACLATVGDRLDADFLYWSFHQNEPLADLDEGTDTLPLAEELVQMTAPPGYDPVFVNPLADCEDGSEVVERGHEFGVEWERTCSCLRPGDGHCWECVSCKDRIDAFNQAGIEDPLYDE